MKGSPHLIWYADQVIDTNSVVQTQPLVYESIKGSAGWTRPSIVGHNQDGAQPALAAGDDGSLHIAWADPAQLNYAAQVQYRCDTDNLSKYDQILYDIARQETYLPPEDPVPFLSKSIRSTTHHSQS